MSNIQYNQAKFLLSAAELDQLPIDRGNEVAFIGRSNAGKSSAINTITDIKGLARTSKTPGRTQLINLFVLDKDNRLVDLPGYGYTKAPSSVSRKWMDKVSEYLHIRKCLKGLVLIMDVRHPLKEQDQNVIKWAVSCDLPVHILLTKADKIKRGPALETLQNVKKKMQNLSKLISVQLFSSQTKIGLEEAHKKLDKWFI